MRRALAAGTMAGLTAIVAPSPGHAWQAIDPDAPVWCGPAPYALGRTSPDLGEAATETEVRMGFEEWTEVPCTSLTTRWEGRTTATAGAVDGVSMVGWVESGWRHDDNAIGVTVSRWTTRGCILQSDMEMNGVHYRWSRSAGSGSTVHARSIVMHEAGHYYGLGHSSDPDATMFFAYSGGVDQLGADDRQGICALYPGDGAGQGSLNCTTTGCPSNQQCIEGTCRVPDGDGSMCSPCEGSADCGGPNDLCLLYPDGAGYCGELCASSSDCGGTDVCINVDGVGQCVRVDGSGHATCNAATAGCRSSSDCDPGEICNLSTGQCDAGGGGAALGQPCSASADCGSGLCLPTATGSMCSQTCDWLEPASCPGGFYCDGNATGTCGTGVCLEGSAGSRPLGDSCERDTDCASLYCDGVCAKPCIPGGATGCPEGYQCQQGSAPGCGSCKREAAGVGEPCDMNEDCLSRLCPRRSGDDHGFCTVQCESDGDCRAGFYCESAGPISVCAPPADGPRPGAVGFACEHNGQCDSGLCATAGDGTRFCTDFCESEADCPAGFGCAPTADGRSVCGPRAAAPAGSDAGAPDDGDDDMGGGGDGCTAVPGGGADGAGGLAWIGLAALAWRRRQARRGRP